MNQIVLEPQRKILDAWSWCRSQKFEFRVHSPGSNYCEPCPWLLSVSFLKQLARWSAYVIWRFHRCCSCQDYCGIYYGCAVLGWNLDHQHIWWETSLVTLVQLKLSPKLPENAHCTLSKRLNVLDTKIWHRLHHHFGSRWKVPRCGIAFPYVSVATSPEVLRWLCDSPRTGCAWRITPSYV